MEDYAIILHTTKGLYLSFTCKAVVAHDSDLALNLHDRIEEIFKMRKAFYSKRIANICEPRTDKRKS